MKGESGSIRIETEEMQLAFTTPGEAMTRSTEAVLEATT